MVKQGRDSEQSNGEHSVQITGDPSSFSSALWGPPLFGKQDIARKHQLAMGLDKFARARELGSLSGRSKLNSHGRHGHMRVIEGAEHPRRHLSI